MKSSGPTDLHKLAFTKSLRQVLRPVGMKRESQAEDILLNYCSS